jgi:lanthanide-dependent methanol dehydrogenase
MLARIRVMMLQGAQPEPNHRAPSVASRPPFSTFTIAFGAAVLFASAACQQNRPAPSSGPRPAGSVQASAPASLPPESHAEDAGQWVRPSRDYANTRFSPLDQITRDNVANLRAAWTFSTGVLNGHEAAPIVVGDTMYVVTPWPNYLYALDLTQAGAPLKWKYAPDPVSAARGVACCDVVNRGVAFDAGRLYMNTLDGYTVAVDAATGQAVWKSKVAEINLGETITMAPLVARGKVFVGNSGGEFGVRGWLTALNQNDGSMAWRAYNTGPDKDVLIGPEFKPYYDQDKGTDLGVKSWPPDAWKIGGGTVWGWLSFDPETNLLYYGTGNPGPWNPQQRPGDNKWTAGVFARDADTGAARWFYQWSPHDLHDYDGINENVLLDLPMEGQTRKVLVRPERNGYVYVLDRTTGQVLSATPFTTVTSSTGVDLKTGRLQYAKEKEPILGVVVREICPASPGAKDWQPSSYSPRTGYMYIPSNNLCQDVESVETSYIAGTPYVGMNVRMYAGPGGHRGEFLAWDPVKGQKVWGIKERFPVWSGTVATGGDVVFYGTMDGWFKAVDARDGTVKWKFKVGSGIVGQPMTYRGPDGKQYVAVLSGVGGWSGAIVAGGLDARDPTGALGFVNAMSDLPQATAKGGMLYVFSLP